VKKLFLIIAAIFLALPALHAQEKTIHVRYNENAQKLVVSEPGYLVLSYDMYLYPAGNREAVGPCTYDYNKDEPEKLARFYDRITPGDKIWMRNIRVLNMATKRAQRVKDYSVTLR
jgi:hypothetical protein